MSNKKTLAYGVMAAIGIYLLLEGQFSLLRRLLAATQMPALLDLFPLLVEYAEVTGLVFLSAACFPEFDRNRKKSRVFLYAALGLLVERAIQYSMSLLFRLVYQYTALTVAGSLLLLFVTFAVMAAVWRHTIQRYTGQKAMLLPIRQSKAKWLAVGALLLCTALFFTVSMVGSIQYSQMLQSGSEMNLGGVLDMLVLADASSRISQWNSWLSPCFLRGAAVLLFIPSLKTESSVL